MNRRALNVGFTGTRHDATVAQIRTLSALLLKLRPDRFHLGDCVGADEQAAHLAHALGIDCVGHPPIEEKLRANFNRYITEYPARSYLERNREIVDVCDILIACPGEDRERLRSGTWATVRYARAKKKKLYVINPRGEVHVT